MRHFVWLFCIGGMGCGTSEVQEVPEVLGTDPVATEPAPVEAPQEETGPAHAFHEVLRPLWHAPAGPQRTEDTCVAAARMNEMATAMAATPPANAEPGFAEHAATLATATGQLVTVCATPDRATFEETFHALHEAFHGVSATCGE